MRFWLLTLIATTMIVTVAIIYTICPGCVAKGPRKNYSGVRDFARNRWPLRGSLADAPALEPCVWVVPAPG